VRPGIVVKEEDVCHVPVRINTTDSSLQFVKIFLVPLVMCFEVEAGNFITMVHGVLLKVGKSRLKIIETCGKITS
jgi:hypothetical protein